jgi:hypothetical protein
VTDDYLSTAMKVYFLTATAWLRYFAATADAAARFQTSMFNARANQTFASDPTLRNKDRVVLDETRAFLRRIGDAGTAEAHRIEYGLEQIGEALAQAATANVEMPLDASDRNVRRYEVKP